MKGAGKGLFTSAQNSFIRSMESHLDIAIVTEINERERKMELSTA